MDLNRYDYREVGCPQCHQTAGTYCMRPSGHSGPIVEPHRPRKTAAHIVWRAEEVALYGQQVTSWDDDAPATSVPVPPPVVGVQLALFA